MSFGQLPKEAQDRFDAANARIEADPGLDEEKKRACRAILAAAAGQVKADATQAGQLMKVADAAAGFLKDPIGLAGKFLGL